MNDPEYLAGLQRAIKSTFGLEAEFVETVALAESIRGAVVWEGEVEVFAVAGHSEAKRCFAWAHDVATGTHAVVVLEIPPVRSARDAVRVSILTEGRRSSKN